MPGAVAGVKRKRAAATASPRHVDEVKDQLLVLAHRHQPALLRLDIPRDDTTPMAIIGLNDVGVELFRLEWAGRVQMHFFRFGGH